MSEVVSRSTDEERNARIVAEAFASFRDANRDAFPAPPVSRVIAAARHRQRLDRYRGWLATAAAVLPAMLLALGSTTLLNLAGGDEPRRADGSVATAPPTPTASPEASASRTPQPGTSTRGREPAGAGDQSRFELSNATVDLPPAGDCPGGVLDFSAGQANDPAGCLWQVGVWRSHHANLDGVAGQEIVTRFTVGTISGVVALRPAGRNAPVRTMGYVITSADTAGLNVAWVGVSPDGLITIGLSGGSTATTQQVRSYRWEPSAQAFAQVDGSTAAPDPEPEPEPVPTTPAAEPSTLEPSGLPSPTP
jgi:hypothetical protein